MSKIHRSAIIEGDVEIGDDVEIGPHAYISGNVFIDSGTKIGAFVHITGNVKMGRNNIIHHSVSIGQPPQDVNYGGEDTRVVIGNNNVIREFVTIHRATGNGNSTIVGSSNYIMAYVHIAHNCKIGNNITIANAAQLAGYVEVHDYAFVSGILGVHQWCRIGSYAMIGGMTRLNQDAPPFFITVGYEPRVIGVNIVGLRRRGFTEENIEILRNAYRIIYRSSLQLEKALRTLEENFPDNIYIKEIVRFYRSSRRGVLIRGPAKSQN